MSLIAELQRRKVFKVGAAYLVVAWLAVQAASIGFPAFDAPPWVLRVFILIALLGFPIAVVMAWVFDITPEGVKLDANATGSKRLFAAAILLIALALGWYFYGQPAFRKGDIAAQSQAAVPVRAAARNSLAVMAFDDLSPAHDQGYFSDGMAEEILNALGRVKELKVIGRSSSFQYKGKNIGAIQIGQALGVAHLLEGSVRRQGDQLRITATLVQTSDGEQEWTQAYDGKLADVFDLQESCARDIAAELKVALASGSGGRLVAKASDSPQAYALFVEAQTLVNRRVGDSLPRAIALLQQATALDPNFARAWSKLAVAYAVLTQYTGGDWAANWKASDAAAQRALALDPNDAEAYAALSYNQFSQRRYAEMVEPMRRALQNDPDNAATNYWAANESSAMGRTADTEARLDAMLRNDPANALVLFYEGAMRWRVGDAAGMLATVRRIGDNDSPFTQWLLAWHSASIGDYEHGAKQYAMAERGLGTKLTAAELGAIYHGTFRDEAQRQAALKIVAAHSDDDWAPTFLLQLGEPARSFATFEQGKSGLSDGYLNWLWQPEAWSRKARQDPSFQGFAKRMGMVDYWKRYGWPDLCKPTPAAGPDAFVCR
jgi:TolB-like protein/Tfp pilus assembly protein PilF